MVAVVVAAALVVVAAAVEVAAAALVVAAAAVMGDQCLPESPKNLEGIANYSRILASRSL